MVLTKKKKYFPEKRTYLIWEEDCKNKGEIPNNYWVRAKVIPTKNSKQEGSIREFKPYKVAEELIKRGYRFNRQFDKITTIPSIKFEGTTLSRPVNLEMMIEFRNEFQELSQMKIIQEVEVN